MARRQQSPACWPGHGDEPEVPDRGAYGLGLAVHDGDREAAAAGGEGVGEAHDSGAHDDEIILPCHAAPRDPCADIGAGRGILPVGNGAEGVWDKTDVAQCDSVGRL